MGHKRPLAGRLHALALPQGRHPMEGHPRAQHGEGAPSTHPGQWGWTQGCVLQMAAPSPV